MKLVVAHDHHRHRNGPAELRGETQVSKTSQLDTE